MFHCKKRRIKTLVWKVYFNPFLCHPITECCINIISVRRLPSRPRAIMITTVGLTVLLSLLLRWDRLYLYILVHRIFSTPHLTLQLFIVRIKLDKM